MTMTKSSYLHSSPSIRDPKSRIVTLKVSRLLMVIHELELNCEAFILFQSMREFLVWYGFMSIDCNYDILILK